MAKCEKYEMITIGRSQISNAPYNPRKMTKKAREELKKDLDEHGLVIPLTWNKRTGNLVAGHQRLKYIDNSEDGKDYELTVAAIDVSEEEEKKLNVLVNNTSLMGEFDIDKLGEMLEEIDYSDFGFDAKDMEDIFGGIDVDMLSDEDLQVKIDSYEEGKAHRERVKKASARENGLEYYTVLIFNDNDGRQTLFSLIGMKDEDYINGEEFTEKLREKFREFQKK